MICMIITLNHDYNTLTICTSQLKVVFDKIKNLREQQEILEELLHLLDPRDQSVKMEEVRDKQTFVVAEWR